MMWTTLFKRTVYVKTAKRLDNPVLACFFFSKWQTGITGFVLCGVLIF